MKKLRVWRWIDEKPKKVGEIFDFLGAEGYNYTCSV